MTLSIELNQQDEAKLKILARQNGTSATGYATQLLSRHLSPVDVPDDDLGDFGGRSVADVILEIGTVSGGPSDLAENHHKYLRGFGEPKSA